MRFATKLGRRRTSIATRDDRGVAGAVGAALLLALLVTVYARVVTTDLPRWGEEAERTWDEDVGRTFNALARAAASALGTESPVSMAIPGAPPPKHLDVPVLGDAKGLRGAGMLRLEPECAVLDAVHDQHGGPTLTDLNDGARGCLAFSAEPAYAAPFAYQVEFGGVLRVQGDRAVVLQGPSLELNATSSTAYRVSIAIPDLRGPSSAASSDEAGLHVDLTPGPASMETANSANAANATWTLDTAYPKAWKTWFQDRFQRADFVESRASPGPGESSADYDVACVPADCSVGAGGLGQVVVTISGPRTDRDDLQLAFSFGAHDVTFG